MEVMDVRIAAAVIGCLAVTGLSGCGHGGTETCAVADYGGGSAGGYQTPQQALNSVLTQHVQWLSTSGWVLKGKSAHGATFASGNDTVDVVKTAAGQWIAGGVTACQ